jgi:8-oxo-dGTP pyrophosphatase MutT (NUDIX family)
MKFHYSYGIILKHRDEYLLVQNRDTEAFIYFFFTNISKWSESYCQKVFHHFTHDEKYRLLYYPFEYIYYDLYVFHNPSKYQKQYNIALKNYLFFKENKWMYDLLYNTFIKQNNLRWIFPKGHIEKNETEIECALREFKEETNISLDDYNTHIDKNKFILYEHYKPFYKFTSINKLFFLEIPEKIKIEYQHFPNIIRGISISNEILNAQWAHKHELKKYIPFYIYSKIEKDL